MTRPEPAPAAPQTPAAPRPPLVGSTMGVVGAVFAMFTGGWLMLAPFALGYQADGADWADPTYADFWAGLGLLALGVIVLAITVADLVGRLRAAGAIATRQQPEQPAGPSATPGAPAPAQDDELASLLKPLIAALSQDTERPAANHPANHAANHGSAVDPSNREMPR